MKIKKFIYILMFFAFTLFGISIFFISSTLSGTKSSEQNTVDLIKEYTVNSNIFQEDNIIYTINYPIFNNQIINNYVYNKIENDINHLKVKLKENEVDSKDNKIYFNLETDIGFLETDFLFIRFYNNIEYSANHKPIKFYKSYILDLKTNEPIVADDIFNNYYIILFNKYKEYFKNNYGIQLNNDFKSYFDVENKTENYQNLFINKKYAEFTIYDYKKGEEVIIRTMLSELKPFMKEKSNIESTQLDEIITENLETSTSEQPIIENSSIDETEQLININDLQNIDYEKYTKFSKTFLNNISLTIKITADLLSEKEKQRQKELELELEKQNPNNIDPNKPMIALTFDDGPNFKNTNRILDILEKNNARATFFVVGRNLDKKAETLKRIHNLGNQIGNHTYNHKNLSKLSADQILYEVESVNQKLEKIIGEGAKIVRVPYGSANQTVLNTIKYPIIMWNVDTRDWETKNTNSTIREIRKNAKDGNIILMHDLYDTTAAACETIIPELINKGFQLVTIEEMMKYKNIELIPGNKYYNALK